MIREIRDKSETDRVHYQARRTLCLDPRVGPEGAHKTYTREQ